MALYLGGLAMRYMLAAAVAICGMSVGAAVAEPMHTAGGLVREGNLCWVNGSLPQVNDLGFGYWRECPSMVHVIHHHHHRG
jgi:hypothetical protein